MTRNLLELLVVIAFASFTPGLGAAPVEDQNASGHLFILSGEADEHAEWNAVYGKSFLGIIHELKADLNRDDIRLRPQPRRN